MTAVSLRPSIKKYLDEGTWKGPLTLQVSDIRTFKGKYFCKLSDGVDYAPGVASSQVTHLFQSGTVKDGDVLMLDQHVLNVIGSEVKIMMLDIKKVGEAPNPTPEIATSTSRTAPTPADQLPHTKPDLAQAPSPKPGTPVAPKPEPHDMPAGPLAAVGALPVPTGTFKTPAPMRSAPGAGPNTPLATPSPFTRGMSQRPTQPIAALNPYNNGWAVRAKVASKGPLRSLARRTGGATSLFSVQLVDDQGTAIEATLWAEVAEKFYDHLQEGKVYIFAKGRVKPANMSYAQVRNDYCINFDSANTQIEECGDAAPDDMQARLCYVALDRLATFVGKRTPVDIIGVVTSTGPLGSVKRRKDGSELARRDLTFADQSGKSVVVTVWGAAAETTTAELEALEAPVVSVSSVLVGDYNGVSVSALSRSVITVEPAGLEADALRAWWASEGHCAIATPAGEGLASALRGGGGRGDEPVTLAELVKPPEVLPPADAKGEYASLAATVVAVDPAQNLYYCACPENNRKVTPTDDGRWHCAFDGKDYPGMVRRYILLARIADATGEATLSFFNDEAEALLGMSADEMALLKEAPEPKAYEAALKRAAWSDWMLRVQSRTQEYGGELRQRVSAQRAERINYATEARRLAAALAT